MFRLAARLAIEHLRTGSQLSAPHYLKLFQQRRASFQKRSSMQVVVHMEAGHVIIKYMLPEYNLERPHESLGRVTPLTYMPGVASEIGQLDPR